MAPEKSLEDPRIPRKGDPSPKVSPSRLKNGSSKKQTSFLHKQGWRHEFGPTVCPIVKNPYLVLQETDDPQHPIHSRPAECGSRQTIQGRPDHPNTMVSPSRGLQVDMHQVAPTLKRPVCSDIQPQITSACVTSSTLPS